LRKELCTDAGKVFLDRYGFLVELSASGQIALREVFEAHLARIDWDKNRFPIRLHPFVSADAGSVKAIAIDPAIAFGRPILEGRGIATGVITDRVDAGEKVEDVAADYNLSVDEVKQAIVYERVA
jgi:uncharacterized protein (DUF433 family)